jgi:mRNA-degrading endonuclease RelE of RelBE toxin-antitoxin system
MQELLSEYRVLLHRRVRKFLRQHPEFRERWEEIVVALSLRPKEGPRITHLKGQFHCSRRWRADPFRVLYDVYDNDREVNVYDADTRGDIY